MGKCKTDTQAVVGDCPEQPPINALCLLPMLRPYPARSDAAGRKRQDTLDEMMNAFGDRFARAYVLVPPHGIIPLHGTMPEETVRYEDMKPDRRHLLWLTVQNQLFEALPAGQRIVCLVAGGEMKGLRKLSFPMIVPLSGLSERGRRVWLEQRLSESNFGIAFALFGSGDEMPRIQQATAAACAGPAA